MKKPVEKERSIGELAEKLEMSQRTIRYYEEIGLLNSIKRVEGGRRVYTDVDLRRLKLIKRLKIMGHDTFGNAGTRSDVDNREIQ